MEITRKCTTLFIFLFVCVQGNRDGRTEKSTHADTTRQTHHTWQVSEDMRGLPGPRDNYRSRGVTSNDNKGSSSTRQNDDGTKISSGSILSQQGVPPGETNTSNQKTAGDNNKSAVLLATLSVLGILIVGSVITVVVLILRRRSRNNQSADAAKSKLDADLRTAEAGESCLLTKRAENIYSTIGECPMEASPPPKKGEDGPTKPTESDRTVLPSAPLSQQEMIDNPGYWSVENAQAKG